MAMKILSIIILNLGINTNNMFDKNYKLFLILCVIAFLFSEISIAILDINQLIYNDLIYGLSEDRVNELFAETRKWQYIGYILIPLLLYLKTNLIAGILSLGTFLFNRKVAYRKLWNIVLKAEFIFVFVIIIKPIFIHFFVPDYSLTNIQIFYPLSLLSILGSENLDPWFQYPLQVINVFELVYWIVLAFLLDKALKAEKGNPGIKIVAASYGPALLIWVVSIMFFTLNIS